MDSRRQNDEENRPGVRENVAERDSRKIQRWRRLKSSALGFDDVSLLLIQNIPREKPIPFERQMIGRHISRG